MLSSFHWVIPELLAGSGVPGLLSPLADDIQFMRECGFRLIVTLTEQALTPGCEPLEIPMLHFPVPDMGIPMPSTIDPVCHQILGSVKRRAPVLIHCRAGLGRTGLMMACCLVARGQSAEQALTTVRQINSNYVQTDAQEQFITHYQRFCLRKLRRREDA